MRKCILTALIILIFPCFLFSQDSLTVATDPPAFHVSHIDSPLLVIKGEEFSRFPSANFMDAVNGLFPWVFSQTPDANNFLFVVNGYILPDINGISLYDIDEVTFTRNNLQGTLYPFSRAGIFYIKTKAVNSRKPVINFNSQYNFSRNKESMVFSPNPYFLLNDSSAENHSMNKTGHYLRNHVSLALGTHKFHLYTSAQLDATKTPHLYQQFLYKQGGSNNKIEGNSFTRQYNLETFLNLDYHFTHKLTAGITGNYFHGNTKQDSSVNHYRGLGPSQNNTLQVTNFNTRLPYYHLGSFINWEPLQNLRNKTYFEYADHSFTSQSTTDSKNYQSDSLHQTGVGETRAPPYDKRYSFRNQLEYELIPSGKFRLGTVLVFSYLHDKVNYKANSSYTQNNLLYSYSYSYYSFKQKLTSLNPMVRFSFSHVFTGYAGTVFLLNKHLSKYTHASRSNPYAGFSFDIKKMLNIHQTVSRLDISFNYGEMTQNNSNNYWLPGINNAVQFYPSPPLNTGIRYTFNQPLEYIIFKNKLTAVQLNSGFFNNRILPGAGWSTLQLQRTYLVPVPVYPNGIIYFTILGKETQTGADCHIAGKLIDKPGRQWEMRLSLLFPHIKFRIDNGALPTPVSPINYLAQAGWQTTFRVAGFYFHANVLYGLNKTYYTYNFAPQPVKNKFNELILNDLLFGDDLPGIKNPVFKTLSVFVQARNLLSSKKARAYYQYDSYAGIGVSLKIE